MVVGTAAVVVAVVAAAVAGVAVDSRFAEDFGIEVDSLVGLEVAAVPSSCCTSLWTGSWGGVEWGERGLSDKDT